MAYVRFRLGRSARPGRECRSSFYTMYGCGRWPAPHPAICNSGIVLGDGIGEAHRPVRGTCSASTQARPAKTATSRSRKWPAGGLRKRAGRSAEQLHLRESVTEDSLKQLIRELREQTRQANGAGPLPRIARSATPTSRRQS